jgi:hypothetical protein
VKTRIGPTGARRACIAIIALAGCSLAACGATSLFNLGARDDAALIIFYGDTSRISAPDTVARGVSFEVSFSTFAGGCIRRVARDDVTATASTVEIRPYDHNSGGNVCTSDLLILKHTLLTRLDTPGRFVIRLIGQQRGASTGITNGPAELTRPVVVR